MELTSKGYSTAKFKITIRKSDSFLFYSGINPDELERRYSAQFLRKMQYSNLQIFNRTTLIGFAASVFNNTKSVINGITYLMQPSLLVNSLSKQMFNNKLESLTLNLIVMKFNNKMYSTPQLGVVNFFEYALLRIEVYKFGEIRVES
jgi:hypothetical protein